MRTKTWSPVLAALTGIELERLLAASATRHVERGSYLAVAGELPLSVHLVESGLVKLMAADARGAEVILGLVAEGDLVGDFAALDHGGQEIDALAVTPLTVTTFDGPTFVHIVTGSRAATLEVARAAVRRSRALTRITLEKAAAPVAERLAGSLLDLAEVLGTRKGGTIAMEMPFGQADLGNLAGMSRETTCKTMRRLRAKGLISYRGKSMTILRPELLERLRCGDGDAGLSRAARASRPSP